MVDKKKKRTSKEEKELRAKLYDEIKEVRKEEEWTEEWIKRKMVSLERDSYPRAQMYQRLRFVKGWTKEVEEPEITIEMQRGHGSKKALGTKVDNVISLNCQEDGSEKPFWDKCECVTKDGDVLVAESVAVMKMLPTMVKEMYSDDLNLTITFIDPRSLWFTGHEIIDSEIPKSFSPAKFTKEARDKINLYKTVLDRYKKRQKLKDEWKAKKEAEGKE